MKTLSTEKMEKIEGGCQYVVFGYYYFGGQVFADTDWIFCNGTAGGGY